MSDVERKSRLAALQRRIQVLDAQEASGMDVSEEHAALIADAQEERAGLVRGTALMERCQALVDAGLNDSQRVFLEQFLPAIDRARWDRAEELLGLAEAAQGVTADDTVIRGLRNAGNAKEARARELREGLTVEREELPAWRVLDGGRQADALRAMRDARG